jgi:hypothetical protein
MIGKRFVAIVLAVGLIVSIGCSVGQFKDEYAKELEAKELATKEQGGLIIPGLEQPIDKSVKGPAVGESPPSPEIAPSEQNQPTASGSPTQGATQSSHLQTPYIDSYILKFYGSPVTISSVAGSGDGIIAEIFCFSMDLVGEVNFARDDIPLPEDWGGATSEVPDYVVIHFPYSRFNDIKALFEGNAPIRLGFEPRTDSQPASAYIITGAIGRAGSTRGTESTTETGSTTGAGFSTGAGSIIGAEISTGAGSTTGAGFSTGAGSIIGAEISTGADSKK